MYVHIFFFFFFNDTATTEIYTLSLHDALPIWHIDATLRASSIVASGAVVNLPGPGRHSIDLDLTVPKGRLEDLLTLVSPNGQSVGIGEIALRAKGHLPPGHSPTLRRLEVNGRFTLRRTTFKKGVQQRIQE